MGNSAMMMVTNDNADPVRTFIDNVTCMYDHGQGSAPGSDLSVFNDQVIDSGQTFPNSNGQYIETKNSGDCFDVTSTFDLKVINANTNEEIGIVHFEELGGWSYKAPSTINVDLSGDPTYIIVTVQ
ncbi:hypothetical protein [Streptomyces sp. NK08204]|uniref:hypothetical protein n=1 Tax=Streptomyces sp. NK08204 TaxID=2873260 RepID=UPI001CEC34B4|nr:hypothetical protein [Streptomyces sp. NK08204]